MTTWDERSADAAYALPPDRDPLLQMMAKAEVMVPESELVPLRARIAELEAALREVLATFNDQGAERSIRSAWADPAQVQAWRDTLAGTR